MRVTFRPVALRMSTCCVYADVAAPAQHEPLAGALERQLLRLRRALRGRRGVGAERQAGGEVAVLGVDDALDLTLAGRAAGRVELQRAAAVGLDDADPPAAAVAGLGELDAAPGREALDRVVQAAIVAGARDLGGRGDRARAVGLDALDEPRGVRRRLDRPAPAGRLLDARSR